MRGLSIAFASLAALAIFPPQLQAEKKAVRPTNNWSGSINDEKLQLIPEAKEVMTSSKELEALWKVWKIDDKMPEIDFKKEFVVLQTTQGSKLGIRGQLDTDSGEFQAQGRATQDLGQGFRYLIVTFPREGVKTVNGKELK